MPIPASAPSHTASSTTVPAVPPSTSSATGVVLAAMKRKIVLWSSLRIRGRHRGSQRQR
jgi:hypothetical protein